MRFEIIDTKLAGHRIAPVEVPRGRNRVEIGTGKGCDVRLAAALPQLAAGLRRALAKEPTDRYPTPEAFTAALAAV